MSNFEFPECIGSTRDHITIKSDSHLSF